MKAFDIALKDIKQGFRSWFALIFMFGVPILMTGMFYFLFGGMGGGDEDAFELPTIAVIIANQDQGRLALGENLVEVFQSEGFEDLLHVTTAEDADNARQAVDTQQAGVAIIIPENFSEAMMQPGGKTEIEVYQDPTLTLGPSIVTTIVNKFTDNFSGSKIALEVAIQQFEEAGLSFTDEEIGIMMNDYIQAATAVGGDEGLVVVESATGETTQVGGVAGLISMLMGGMMIFYAFFTGVSTVQSVLTEEERGTLPRLFTTPTLQRTILTGKFLATGIMVIVEIVVLLIFGDVVFGFEWGDPFLLALVVLGITISASTFGIFVISFVRSTKQAGAVIGGGVTVTGMLGMIPIFTLSIPNPPQTTEVISKLVPQGWAVAGLRTVMEGGSTEKVLLSVGVLLAWSLVFFLIGNSRFKRRYV